MSKIILIGGPPRCGKTTLAQKISKEIGIMWVSTDALDDIAQEYVSGDKKDSLFPKTALRIKSGGGNDEMYEAFSVESIVSAYRKQAETVHKAVESFVACANKEGWDYVIEGYHVTPKLISKLRAKSSVILISTKAEEVVKRSIESNVKNDWLRDKTKKQETFSKIATMIELYSTKLKQEAEEFNTNVIDIAGDFQGKLKEAFESLIK
ncbi:AAA family ATPase [Patescibacteria group bacterium]|nr:AAA family ATPase [Patescibacteria group bacterium]